MFPELSVVSDAAEICSDQLHYSRNVFSELPVVADAAEICGDQLH
jgi:hypothetical protein